MQLGEQWRDWLFRGPAVHMLSVPGPVQFTTELTLEFFRFKNWRWPREAIKQRLEAFRTFPKEEKGGWVPSWAGWCRVRLLLCSVPGLQPGGSLGGGWERRSLPPLTAGAAGPRSHPLTGAAVLTHTPPPSGTLPSVGVTRWGSGELKPGRWLRG